MDRENEFRIIQLSDIHGADFLIPEIADELRRADVVILAGDITHFGHAPDAEHIVQKIEAYNLHILAVAGNCDHPDVNDLLDRKGINLHLKNIRYGEWHWTGLSGSLPCPGSTPFEYAEEDAGKWLGSLQKEMKTPPDFFVSHQPPIKTRNDRISFNIHVGSKSVRKFIEATQPLVCFTAHIHEGIGTDRIGDTLLINPGPFRTGKYAIITISGEKSVNAEIKQITV